MAKSFYVWSLVIYFFEIFCVVFVEGSFSGIQSTLPNLQAVGSTVTVSIQVTQSTGFATIQWKFDTIVVAEIVNNPSVNEFVYQTEATAYKPRLVLGAIKVSNVIVNTNLTFSSLSLPDSGIVITANLDGGSGVSSSDSVILNVTVCPELQCVVSYDNLTSCTYNESGCTSKITCCDGTTTFNATCQADAIWAANGQICRPENTSIDPDPLPGWAIFLIVLAALVVVFAVLFIVWWLVEAFRECLHGVSECFPEDHCCGKGSC